MYIESIGIKNFRTFRDVRLEFSHRDRRDFDSFPRPKLPNINLLLGNNGTGKTTLLKAVALASLGPAVTDSGIFPYRLIRRAPERADDPETTAAITALYYPHQQDQVPVDRVESQIKLTRKGDIEQLRWDHPDEKTWHPIYSEQSDAFFFVGYGATRRVEKQDRTDMAGRKHSAFARAHRIQSLFEEAYSLLPLSAWLPSFQDRNPGRHKQVTNLINRLLGGDRYRFTGEVENGEYIFEKGGLKVPFPALSDGYRAYLGWICDLLYHICMTCPSGCKLVDNHGIVMVDEIDLHIHPKWQLSILPVLAKALPNIQFIVTSHSPLVVGSLEWMNIITMVPGKNQTSRPKRIEEGIHGLDADQILLTGLFGLNTTRAPAKDKRLKELTENARKGDIEAAKALMAELSKGMDD